MATHIFIPSGAGSPGFAGIVSCLRQDSNIHVFSGDSQPNPYGKNLSDGFVQMPSSDHTDYLQAVVDAASRFSCSTILPITTRELPILAANADKLKSQGLFPIVSPFPGLSIANHKAELYRYSQELNIPVANFAVVSNKSDLLDAVKSLGSEGKNVIMKPAEGNGSRGFRIICPQDEAQHNYFNSKAGSVYTTLDSIRIEMPDTFSAMVVCEYLPGEEYSVDLLAERGKTLAIATRLREKTVSGISVKGHFLRDTQIENFSYSITEALQLHGPIGIQFKRDKHGVAKMIEINPRLQGAVSTAIFGGINFPLLAIEQALGRIPKTLMTIDEPISFNRYWMDIKS